MMKGGFQVVQGALDLVQPHEQWEYSTTSSVGYPNVSSNTFPRSTAVDNSCTNLERNELSMWVEHVTKQLIEDLPADQAGPPTSFQASSTMVYEDDEDNSHNNINVPSSLLGPRKTTMMRRRSYFDSNNIEVVEDEKGLSLITLLLECAVAISVDNLGEAHRMLLELTQMASPYGPSCADRVVAYFSKAMASRVINSWLGICSPLINQRNIHSAFQVFNNVSPFVKFAHFTSNQAILEALHGHNMVHIVDLDIMQGLQWPALFHILATRFEGPPHVRMTGMGTSMEILVETGKQLSNFAKRLGMSFEFHPIGRKFGDIVDVVRTLQIRRGEALAVHWSQHSLYDATGPDWKTMRLLQDLAPKIITLVEQEISHGGSFLDRFVGSLHYYSTLFDSLGAFLGSEDQNRHRVEQGLLYREINNVLAIGGPARSGEDKYRSWRSELGRNICFLQVPMSGNSMAQAQLILNMFPPALGYSLVQGDGTLRLGWKETSLFTASAWTTATTNTTTTTHSGYPR